jgi:YbbR domain-containing protein
MKIALPDLILRNFWLKFFSIAMATVIWLAIHYGIRNEFSISQLNINNLLAQEYVKVPVSTVAAPGDARLFKINPSEVVVIAVGEKTALRKAARKSIRVYVDLTNFHSRQSPAEELHADVPPDINVLEISPSTVAVEQVSR